MRHRTGTRGQALSKLITLAMVLVFLLVCVAARGDEARFERQVTFEERRAVSLAIVANLIRRQNLRFVDETRRYEEYVPETDYPTKYTQNGDPLPSPSQRSWNVSVQEEMVANPDKNGFWASSTRTVYRANNSDGEDVTLTIEWTE